MYVGLDLELFDRKIGIPARKQTTSMNGGGLLASSCAFSAFSILPQSSTPGRVRLYLGRQGLTSNTQTLLGARAFREEAMLDPGAAGHRQTQMLHHYAGGRISSSASCAHTELELATSKQTLQT